VHGAVADYGAYDMRYLSIVRSLVVYYNMLGSSLLCYVEYLTYLSIFDMIYV
jgi:hypothetical protein